MIGRSGSIDLNFGDGGCAATYTYSHSRGLYVGAALEGCVIISRSDVNHRFYGRVVTPSELLRGEVQPPRAARPLYDALQEATSAMSMPTYGTLPLLLSPHVSSSGSSSRSGTYGSSGPSSTSNRQSQELSRTFFNITDNHGLANSSYDTVYSTTNAVTSSYKSIGRDNPIIINGQSR